MQPRVETAHRMNTEPRWRKIKRFLGRAWDAFPVTVLGILVLGAGVWTLKVFAAESMDMVLRFLGLGAIALVVLSLVLVVLTTMILKLRGAPPWPGDLTVETGVAVETGVRLPWLGFLPLIQVRFEWLNPGGVQVVPRRRWMRLKETVVASERGEHAALTRRVVVQDVLGLSQLAIRWRQPAPITILPRIGQLARLRVLRSLAGGDEWPHPMGLDDGDRVELRRYVAGDPARFIHWKIFGRTRRLMVRMPERALSRADRTAAYLIAGSHDDATAATARLALEEGSLGVEWVFAADGTGGSTENRAEALAAVVRSKSAAGAPASGLLDFVRRSEKRGPMSLVIFAPPTAGPWLDSVLAVLRHRPQGFRVVIGVDEVVEPDPGPRFLGRGGRWLFRPILDRRNRVHVRAAVLETIRRRLARPMIDVVVVNRSNGQIVQNQPAGTRLPQRHAGGRARRFPVRSTEAHETAESGVHG